MPADVSWIDEGSNLRSDQGFFALEISAKDYSCHLALELSFMHL